MATCATSGPTRLPVTAKTDPKIAPMTAAHAIHPQRARPPIRWTAPKMADDAMTPIKGTRSPRKSSSSPTALAVATARIALSPAPSTAGRSAA